jgi:hypothetical protein
MESNWFFTRNGKDCLGPFSSQQLRQLAANGLLLPSDLVLREGEQKWVKASSIPGLFPKASAAVNASANPAASSDVADGSESAPPSEDTSSEPSASSRRTLWQALGIVGGLVIIGLLVLLATADSATRQYIGTVIVVFFVLVLVIAGSVGLILFFLGTISECPKCNKLWARMCLGRKVIERKKCYGLVTRSAHSSSTGSVSGSGGRSGGTVHSSGTTTWQERVPVIRTTYEVYYRCKYCDFRWTVERVEQEEDFERA